MTHLSTWAASIALTCATLMACGPPISGIPENGCPLSDQSVCLCPDGTYKALLCASDGTIYCSCPSFPAVMTPSDLDASPDLSQDLGEPEDMPVDMPPEEMGIDMLADMPVDMPSDMPVDMCAQDDAGCPPIDCDTLLAQGDLPTPWSQQELGFKPEDLESSYGFGRDRLCMRAAGNDVWSSSDRFYYVSQPYTGDFDLSVKVSELTGDQDYTKLGIMFRTLTDATSPFVMLQLTRSQGSSMLARDVAGERAAVTAPQLPPQAPYWLRLIRHEDTFHGYTSPDGAAWKPLAAFDASGMAKTGRVGFALASRNPLAHADVTLDEIEFRPVDPGMADCPAGIACDEVNTYRGIDMAVKSGLNMQNFQGQFVDTITVTRADGQSVGTLHDALQQANQNAQSGGYTIIDVDTTQVTTPIEVIASGSPRAANVWLRGNGATIRSAPSETNTLLKLDEHVVIEGFRFLDSHNAIVMDTEGGASSKRRDGIWIHHNSFDQCDQTCIRLSPTLSTDDRHITISHNTFGEDSTIQIDAIDASNSCDPTVASCLLNEQNLSLSIHHNLFGTSVHSGYPRGGAQALYYNNVIRALRAPGLDMSEQGRLLSRRNIYTGTGTQTPVDVFTRGAAINNETDFFEQGATRNTVSFPLPESMFPDYFTFYYLSRDVLIDALEDNAGPPAASP